MGPGLPFLTVFNSWLSLGGPRPWLFYFETQISQIAKSTNSFTFSTHLANGQKGLELANSQFQCTKKEYVQELRHRQCQECGSSNTVPNCLCIRSIASKKEKPRNYRAGTPVVPSVRGQRKTWRRSSNNTPVCCWNSSGDLYCKARSKWSGLRASRRRHQASPSHHDHSQQGFPGSGRKESLDKSASKTIPTRPTRQRAHKKQWQKSQWAEGA